jgi:hypothetical protein
MKPLPAKSDTEFSTITVDLEIESTMENAVTFMYHLKKEEELVKIEKMNIRQPRQSSSKLKIHLMLTKIIL